MMESMRARLFNAEIGIRAAMSIRGKGSRSSGRTATGPVDLYLCIVDHYEPQVGRPPERLARQRVEDWLRRYPKVADSHRDAEGRRPPHSFFYPWDEYDEWEMRRICELCQAGYGEIELHLHHRDDTDETLRRKIRDAIREYRRRGALSQWPDGRPAFGFIHGNWALDNSRQESGQNYCGVNNELDILQEEGCYADFTFPAWQHSSQPRQVNSIYYAVDDPALPKSYDSGIPAHEGRTDRQGLLMIQGPLAPFFTRRRGIPSIAIDDGDLASYRRYHPSRLDRWVRAGISVQGRPDRVFVKLHCHGAADRNREALLGEDLDALFRDAEERYNDGRRYRLHYVSAREMYNVVKSTEETEESGLSLNGRNVLPRPSFNGAEAHAISTVANCCYDEPASDLPRAVR